MPLSNLFVPISKFLASRKDKLGDRLALLYPTLREDFLTLLEAGKNDLGKIRNMETETILEKLDEVVDGRSIAELRFIWTVPRSEISECQYDYRMWEIIILLSMKEHYTPKRCFFQATEVSDVERDFLESHGIKVVPPTYVSQKKGKKGEIDIFYGVNANVLILNDLIWHRWSKLNTDHLLLLNSFHCMRSETESETPALDLLCDIFTKEKIFVLFNEYNPRNIYCYRLTGDIPKLPKKPKYKMNLVPFYQEYDKKRNFGRLVEMTTFDHIYRNIALVQEQLSKLGYTANVLSKLKKVLDGRKIKRIRLIGIGQFAYHYAHFEELIHCLYQLSLIFAIRDHFKPHTVTSQEPRSTHWEQEYLKTTGIEVLKETDLKDVEEDLEEDEVVLYYMMFSFRRLYNNLFWANRKQARKMVVFGNDTLEDGQCEPTCDYRVAFHEIMRKEYIVQSEVLENGIKDSLQTPTGVNYMLEHAFTNQAIISYPKDMIEGVGDDEPIYSPYDKIFGPESVLPPCSCGKKL
ncbi:hypothetical protein L596_005449 [Steinernema carpocapsae]|uniref:SRR1-like domain-containing protein n=1 Tax=Steinernema carpocapsae TaxID=34508 RepID=A0A4U8V3U1_STECR|nr:hypothetical protein L596_005449 [Steinernema carpocapsae]